MKSIKFVVFFSTLVTLALCFSGCSKSDDNEGGGKATGKKTLKIDGEAYYCGSESNVEQTSGSGMYFKIYATEDEEFEFNGKILIVNIPPSRVSELKVGDVFQSNDILVRNFNNISTIEVNSYSWNAVDGSIRISGIRDKELTIQIQKLVVDYHNSSTKHTIEGSANLHIQ